MISWILDIGSNECDDTLELMATNHLQECISYVRKGLGRSRWSVSDVFTLVVIMVSTFWLSARAQGVWPLPRDSY